MRQFAVGALLLMLAGCASGGFPGSANDAPKWTIGGRWILAAPNAPPCGMEFSEGDSGKGSVKPDGGCPASFYRSRRWIFDQSTLTVLDDTGAAIGQLTLDGGQFQGKAFTGTPISLPCPIIPP
ncbi:MAG: AprI/Inh family metalloprotease inhibitor, partial [Pseudolabrys sp.]|nr:AprI/Inh family metalloprotease inhibitor [Pseudolabrys sp.]